MEQSATVELGKLIKAQAMFEQFRCDMQDDRDQMGAMHAFKMCYELALRTMKAALAAEGQKTTSPKEIFRKAALVKIIADPAVWFNFQEKRNLTAHAYEQENVTSIVNFDSRVQVNEVVVDTYEQGISVDCSVTFINYNLSEQLRFKFDLKNGLL